MNDEIAKQQVNAFILELQNKFGIGEDELFKIVNEVRWLHQRRQRFERYGEWMAKSIITVLVSAFFAGAAWALVHFIESLQHMVKP